jgi:hypothetical protein
MIDSLSNYVVGFDLADFVLEQVLGVLLGVMATLVSVFVIPRQLWRLHDAHQPRALKIVASFREPEKTPAYRLPVTGVGQLRAVGALAPSLVRSYGWRWKESVAIVSGSGPMGVPQLAGNLILLGGTSRNEVTRRLLEKHGDRIGIRQEFGDTELYGDRLFFREDGGSWRAFGGTPAPLDGDGSGQITEDYALILRMPNPWDSGGRAQCVVFSGVHTFGTAAAATHFVRQWWKPRWWRRAGVAALIRVEVEDGHVIGTKEIEFRRLTWPDASTL